MKNKIVHNPVQVFYTVFGITFVITLLNYTIFPFTVSLAFMVIAVMSYAYMMGMFHSEPRQIIDLKQIIADIKESKLETYALKMIIFTNYLLIYLVIIPFLWLGLLLVFSIFIPLIMGEVKPFEIHIISWLALILFGLFVFISHSSAKDELKNGAMYIEKYIVQLTPQNLEIIKKNDTLIIPWNTVKNIYESSSRGEYKNYCISILYESDNDIDELKIPVEYFRVGTKKDVMRGTHHINLEEFFIKYWLKANGRDLVNIK